MVDAKRAIDLNENMVKAYDRLTQAQLHLGRFKAAVMSARAGERLLNVKASGQQTLASCWTKSLPLERFKETMQPLMAEPYR